MNGTTTASRPTTACSSWPSTARWSPASASASRARATSPWNRKAPSAGSRTSRSRNCRATNPTADEVADVDKGLKCLFTGVDLSGWKVEENQQKHWKMTDGVLRNDGAGAGYPYLWNERKLGDFEMVCDWLGGPATFALRHRNGAVTFTPEMKGWNRVILQVKGDSVTATVNGKRVLENMQLVGVPKEGHLGLVQTNQPIQYRNLFIRDLN